MKNSSVNHNMRRVNKWRLLKAFCLIGNPRLKTWVAWLFILPPLVWSLYYLAPVFVYYTVGVPPKEALEEIRGVWREEGTLGSTRFQLIAPSYYVDTDSGSRKVHCGFPTQRRLCLVMSCQQGKRCKVLYDSYFGILAYEQLDPLEESTKQRAGDKTVRMGGVLENKMSYEEGVFYYARPKHLLHLNRGAHYVFAFCLLIYGYFLCRCWKAIGQTGAHS